MHQTPYTVILLPWRSAQQRTEIAEESVEITVQCSGLGRQTFSAAGMMILLTIVNTKK